jgi:ATP-dependent DNA helicase RecQ
MKQIKQSLEKFWGYDSFLPLQRQAMECITQGQDSVVVLPTGGGKSLCYQAPAVSMPGLSIVVSPLISLMKDQVDALKECGVPAMRLDSTLSFQERDDVISSINAGQLKLLYLSPERLLSDGFADFLARQQLSFIAIDEAHCVSMWGHDFRPEYRQLGCLKRIFDDVTIAAYTATATDQVREDIAEQLGLKNPAMLVGSFDRPNLVYKVFRRNKILEQACEVIDRHKSESGVIYCIRRRDVESLCDKLCAKGYKAAPYHAGMTNLQRKRNQDRFINEKVDIIVATVAFGMGIDKSNVRYVLHAGMPKSLEHYQQESGRAGRDGLEAECCLFYSGSDYGIWRSLMSDMPEDARQVAMNKLSGMYNYCTGGVCRHDSLLRYFGQQLDKDDCQACDVCMGELDYMADPAVIAQKILSCIVRLGEYFGAAYTSLVLTGSKDKRIIEKGHDQLSTFALLKGHNKSDVRSWIEELCGQGFIEKAGEFNVLNLTAKGWDLLKNVADCRLTKPAEKKSKKSKVSKVASDSWQGVDRDLFELLREWRSELSAEKHIPAYVVFGDAALRDLARQKPQTFDDLLGVKGIGEKKQKQYGQAVLEVIKQYSNDYTSS